jgi:acetamidase/formamidase
MSNTYHLDDTQPHSFWDKAHPPRLRIESGDTVIFETLEASAGQIDRASIDADLNSLSIAPIHPLTGPLWVEGAQPGHTLEVEILELRHKGWGWNAVCPGAGLLADEFAAPYLHHYRLDGDTCYFNEGIGIPFAPFCGIMGVAPAQAGRFDTVPPRHNAGELDLRLLTEGSRLAFPVLTRGALFSCGDGHAARGAGEVNGTGIETPMTATLRFHLHRHHTSSGPRFEPAGRPAGNGSARHDYFTTTAHGPDIFENARDAVRRMIEHLAREHRLTREQAYCLCGAAVDLRTSEVLDGPRSSVSAHLPRAIFEKRVAA